MWKSQIFASHTTITQDKKHIKAVSKTNRVRNILGVNNPQFELFYINIALPKQNNFLMAESTKMLSKNTMELKNEVRINKIFKLIINPIVMNRHSFKSLFILTVTQPLKVSIYIRQLCCTNLFYCC